MLEGCSNQLIGVGHGSGCGWHGVPWHSRSLLWLLRLLRLLLWLRNLKLLKAGQDGAEVVRLRWGRLLNWRR